MAGIEWCSGPLKPWSVRLVGQVYKGTCSCGRHDTRSLDGAGVFAQAHVRLGK